MRVSELKAYIADFADDAEIVIKTNTNHEIVVVPQPVAEPVIESEVVPEVTE